MRRNRIFVGLWLFLFLVSHLVNAAQITQENAGNVRKFGQLKGHTGPVFSLAFSPDSKRLVSGGSGSDTSVRLWNIQAFNQHALLTGNTKQIASVAFTADGNKVVSAGYDGNLRIWDAAKQAQPTIISKSADGAAISVDNLFTSFSADGNMLAYSNDLGEGPFLFHVVSRKQMNLHVLVPPFDEGPGNVALNMNGSILAAVGKGNVIHLIDAAGKEFGVLKNSGSDYSGYMVFSRNSALLAVSNYDTSNIQLWNLQTKQAGSLLVGHKNNSDGTMMITGLTVQS